MRNLMMTAACAAVAGPACAAPITLKPIAELRFRYENVDQEGLAHTSGDDFSIRGRLGLSGTSGRISAIVIGQGAVSPAGDAYDGLNGLANRPLVADPDNIALYVAQIQYRAPGVTVTAGRQRIVLDDERFVGNVAFRDNAQTFDAVRAEATPIRGLKADVSYVWGVRTIWGFQGTGARQQAVSGDTVLANLSYVTSLGTLTGFGYWIDQDEAAVQGFRLSSKTVGARFAGSHAFSKTAKLSYQLSYAHQTDFHNNPNAYAADYYLADAMLEWRMLRIGAGYEVLGADRGVALTSFQTPLGTNFKFQGWADKFLTTPPNGVRDLYGSAGYGWKKAGPFAGVLAQIVYHDFRSDRLDQHYGTEWDVILSGKIGKTTLSVRYADYDARRFAADTRKIWLQADWAF
ncbi:hypothetical protein [Sphingomonas sp.]|uniref:hypothetical protein n=1 Tax=Sphingomonas sp. TaxID=28214 RepID=UPI000DB71818|nr:hypothetical protein [Sphingomonas sp.]PZU11641.1 MAG: hypothetical protein DI605_01245 [Sphingomonas sp.]